MEKKKVIELSVYVPTINWIWWNKDRWLITIVNEWQAVLTMADKDLWATDVYDGTEWTWIGKVYQWWNSHWFSVASPVLTQFERPNEACDSEIWWSTRTSNYQNLWESKDWDNRTYRWPLDEWWHIYMINDGLIISNLSFISKSEKFAKLLKFNNQGWVYWDRSRLISYSYYRVIPGTTTIMNWYWDEIWTYSWNLWMFIRPVKDTPEFPEWEWWEQIY